MPYKDIVARRAAARRRYWENPDRFRTESRAWKKANPDKVRAHVNRWKAANPEKVLRKCRRYRGLPEPTRPMPALCECCGQPPTETKVLHLDHCHETKTFRGWLCGKCNRAIGLLGDNAAGVFRAYEYLRPKYS